MAVTRQTVENPDVLYKHSKWVALPLYLPLQFPAKFALLGISSRGAGQKMKSLSFRSESRSFEAEARPQRVLKNLEVRTSRAVEPKDQTYFIAAELGRSPRGTRRPFVACVPEAARLCPCSCLSALMVPILPWTSFPPPPTTLT